MNKFYASFLMHYISLVHFGCFVLTETNVVMVIHADKYLGFPASQSTYSLPCHKLLSYTWSCKTLA